MPINYDYVSQPDDRMTGDGVWRDTDGRDLYIGDMVRYASYPEGLDIPAIVTENGFEAQGAWADKFDAQSISRTCYFGTEHEVYLSTTTPIVLDLDTIDADHDNGTRDLTSPFGEIW